MQTDLAPTLDEFRQWRDNPVTKWAFRAVQEAASKNREAWISASWEAGKSDPALLSELRTRADAYAALENTTYEEWCAINRQEPCLD